MSIISSTITQTVTLGLVNSYPTYASPLTITSAGAVETTSSNAIYGPDTQAWTVTNAGAILATGPSGFGLDLKAGGNVDNAGTGALITGYAGGIRVAGAAGTVANAATINGMGPNGVGINLAAGGSVGNTGMGLIQGYSGIDITGAVGTLSNAGTISATGNSGNGVYLDTGGAVDNTGVIEGRANGVDVTGAAGTVTNSGTIAATGNFSNGVYLDAGGSVDNAGLIQAAGGVYVFGPAGTITNSGSISGTNGVGVFLLTGGTVIDSGTISGSGGTAVDFGGTGGNLLVLGSGYKLFGGAVGSGTVGATNTLELGGSVGAALTVGYNGLGLTNFQDVLFGSGGYDTLKVGSTVGTLPVTISGFALTSDIVDLTAIGSDGKITGQSGTQVTIAGSLGAVTLQLDPSDSTTFTISPDGSSGTDITLGQVVPPASKGPVLGGLTATSVSEGGVVTLGASDTVSDADDTLGAVTITSLPGDLTGVNGGTYTAGTGTWTGTGAEFNALSFTAGEQGTFTLSISAATTGAEAGTTAGSYTLTVNEPSPALTTPVISGMAQQGSTLTASAAVSNEPTETTITYQWQANYGSGFVDLTGETGLTLALTEADEGATLRIVATSADSDGRGTTATRNATSAVTEIAEGDLAATVSGLAGVDAVQGTPVSVTSITDGGTAVRSGVMYQWQINNGSGFVNISGATKSTYTPSGFDEDKKLQVIVTYADAGGAEALTKSAGTVQARQDHWKSPVTGNWTKAADWANGVPTATLDAVVDASGSYTVTLSSVDSAHGLIVDDAGAVVADSSSGSLTLDAGIGTLAISHGTFHLGGGALRAGSISIASGGTLLVSKSYTGLNAIAETITDNGQIRIAKSSTVVFTGAISGSGSVTVQNSAKATLTGAITGSETFTIANQGSVVFDTAISGTGSFNLLNAGNLEFGAADSEDVTFGPGATGTLKIDDSLTAPFTGQISGLTRKNAVDLADLAWSKPSKMRATFAGSTAGGTLTVTNGTQSVALSLKGNYTTASWTLSKDGSGGTLVVDPPVTGSLTPDQAGSAQGQIDLSDISFGADTTLGYSANSANTGGTLTVSDGSHATSLALLGQYAAASFVMASDGHGGTMITDAPANQQTWLSLPHA
jgi:hypothetical protein